MSRYVALGSSMAAGPGIRPSADGAPFAAGRSARNYPHLVAEKLGLELVDVTYSGATTANVLTDPQDGAPPQVDALDGSEDLVTVTVGGNDAGYVPLLFAAAVPRLVRSLPLIGRRLREQLDPTARDRALVVVAESLKEVGRTVRHRSPRATVLFVDYPDPAATGGRGASTLRCRRRARSSDGRHAGAPHWRGGRRHRLRVGSGCAGEPRTPCLVSGAVDDEVRGAATGQTRATAPQRGRHASGRRPRRGAGNLTSWGR